MIHYYSHAELIRWNHQEHRVQLDLPGRQLPLGYCDGSEEDEDELRAMALEEGVDKLVIHKKRLKTGREIWTVGELQHTDELESDMD